MTLVNLTQKLFAPTNSNGLHTLQFRQKCFFPIQRSRKFCSFTSTVAGTSDGSILSTGTSTDWSNFYASSYASAMCVETFPFWSHIRSATLATSALRPLAVRTTYQQCRRSSNRHRHQRPPQGYRCSSPRQALNFLVLFSKVPDYSDSMYPDHVPLTSRIPY